MCYFLIIDNYGQDFSSTANRTWKVRWGWIRMIGWRIMRWRDDRGWNEYIDDNETEDCEENDELFKIKIFFTTIQLKKSF